jgi:hypothetical protein
MNPEHDSLPPEELQPVSDSLLARLANVFVFPGEVFEALKSQPHRVVNWLVPMVIACLVGVACSLVPFYTPSFAQQIRETQLKAIQDKIDAGKIPKDQGQQVIEMMDRLMSSPLVKVAGGASGGGAALVGPCLAALVVWLLGMVVFKAGFGYPKALEACALAGLIATLGQVVRILLALAMNNMFVTPGPAVLIHDYNPLNLLHLAAATFNVMSLWHVGVLAVGLAKLSGVSWLRAAAWLYPLWALMVFGFALMGWGVAHLR